MAETPFRILSIDGGGILGAFAASALARLEQATGRRVVDHFDLITGTSTGGIIALGLAMGATAQDICQFYATQGPTIFPPREGLRDFFGRLRDRFRPKYTPAALRPLPPNPAADCEPMKRSEAE